MRSESFIGNQGAGWGPVALTAGLLLALLYVGQNTLAGPNGFLSLLEKRQEINLLEAELAAVEAAHARVARNVQLLSPPLVDEDLLDERARVELGYARPGELVIFRDQDQD